LDVTLACDIMMNLDGSIRPAMYLANELTRTGYNVSIMSPIMSDDVEKRLHTRNITPINLRANLFTKHFGLSLLWFETWAREALINLNSRNVDNGSSATINFSQVISVPSLAWYLQGPPSVALRDMEKELSTGFRIAYTLLKPIIGHLDERLVTRMSAASDIVIANSKFCASMYSNFGVKVNDIIYPPLDCQMFNPSTAKPSSDYVLTYFGKETKFSVVKQIADKGVKIKAFGSKTPFIQRELLNHPNVELLGHVTTPELLEAYSNALFTLFPFTHEPFGYVPLESMACGTPVLTSNMQGPREYVTEGFTGWLNYSDDALVLKAVDLWAAGYPSHMRSNCVKVASKFDVSFYLEKWFKILSNILS